MSVCDTTYERELIETAKAARRQGSPMKALTICQPFAHLIATGQKIVENRVWSTSYRGTVAIHAGKSRDWLSDGDEQRFPGMAYSAIVAIADLVYCIDVDRIGLLYAAIPQLQGHIHVEGPYCWVLQNIRRLDRPVPCSARSLWEVPERIIEKINEQLNRPHGQGATVKESVVTAEDVGQTEATEQTTKQAEDGQVAQDGAAAMPAEEWMELARKKREHEVADSEKRIEDLKIKIHDQKIGVADQSVKALLAEEEAKAQKKQWESDREYLRNLQVELGDKLDALDFLRKSPLPDPPSAGPLFDGKPGADIPADESWRQTPLDKIGTLGLGDKNVGGALRKAGIETLGQLADWTAGGKTLEDIPGIGSERAAFIEKQCDEFWAAHATVGKADSAKPEAEPAAA
jgi:hypothetical protein